MFYDTLMLQFSDNTKPNRDGVGVRDSIPCVCGCVQFLPFP